MRYVLLLLVVLYAGFFLGAWYGSQGRECYTLEVGGVTVVQCR